VNRHDQPSPVPSPTDQSPEARLQRGKLAYQRGDYAAAVLTLRPLLYPQTLLAQEDQLLLAHKLLALSYFFEHDEPGAEQEFNLLLSLRPDFALDQLVDPLKAVAFLDEIRRRNEQRLEEIRHRQQEEEQRQKAEAEALQKACRAARPEASQAAVLRARCLPKAEPAPVCARSGCPSWPTDGSRREPCS
jgi:hypothetical protein